MKTINKRKMMSSSALRWFTLSVLGICAAAYALTPANTVITNKAVVEYYDEVGNFFDSESNPAEVTVGEVYAATIEQDRLDYTGAPGQQVYIPYTLKNNGNAVDTFTLTLAHSAAALSGGYGGADLSGSTIAVYPDDNGDGEPDTGADAIASGSTIDVDGETVQQLVVAVSVPGTASAADEIGLILTATSGNTTVDDLTSSNGVDAAESTVHGRVTVSTDAVLVLTKDSQVNSDGTIDYTLTVKNNGSTTATDVEIYDLMPYADNDGNGVLSAGDTKLTYEAASVSSAGIGNVGDTAALSETDFTVAFAEATLGVDLNDDGDVADTFDDLAGTTENPIDELNGIYALDASLAQNVEIEVTYTVTVPSTVAAGTDILNTFCVVADLDGAGAATDTAQCSNETIDEAPQLYGVTIGDTSTTGAGTQTDPDGVGSTTYEAQDDDDDNNDIQLVDGGSEGMTLTFYHVIQNDGNGNDRFTVSAATSGGTALFPAGTTFTYLDATGSVLAGNTTPIIAAGATAVIQIRATLPTSISGGDALFSGGTLDVDSAGLACVDADVGTADDCTDGTPFSTVLTATSVGDGSETDTTSLQLTLIAQAAPDLGNVETNNVAGTSVADGTYDDTDIVTSGDFHPDGGATDGSEEPYYIAANGYVPGDVVTFDLMVSNETGQSDSFLFDVEYLGYDGGSGFDEDNGDGGTESASAGALPAGWAIRYLDSLGNPVTSTSLLPGDGTANSVFYYTAEITISTSGANSPAGEYDFRFSVESVATGETDTKVDRLVVVEDCQINLTEGQADAVQAGGTVDFDHILRNNGNTTEFVELSSVFGSAANGWSQIIQIEQNGSPGTYVPLALDAAVLVRNVSGNGSVFVGDEDGDGTADGDADDTGKLTIELAPGDYINVRIRTFVPANASAGATRSITLTADPGASGSFTSSCGAVTNTDTVEVIDQQVRISKTVAVNTNCDCLADDADFAEAGSADVLPGQCVIWKLFAENQGSTTAYNVVIRDAITDYSALATDPGSGEQMQVCASGAAAAGGECVSDNSGTAPAHDYVSGGTLDGNNVYFPVGVLTGDPDSDLSTGGTLVPGDHGSAMFCVEIQ